MRSMIRLAASTQSFQPRPVRSPCDSMQRLDTEREPRVIVEAQLPPRVRNPWVQSEQLAPLAYCTERARDVRWIFLRPA